MRPDVPLLIDTDGPPGGPGVVSLRLHVEADTPRVLEQCLDPVSRAWTTVPLDYTLDQARRFVLEAMPGGWDSDQEWAFAVDVDGRFGGTVSLRNEGEGRAEIAYGAHPDVRGTGAMERALRLLLAWGFDQQPDGRGLSTVVWWANRGNWASRRLAWRLGFSFEGTVRQWLPQRGQLLDGWFGTLLATDERSPRTPWLDAPVIESARLPIRVRPAREADIPRGTEGCRDPETAYWLGGMPQPYTDEIAAGFVLRRDEEHAAGRGLGFVVADSDDDRLLGVVSLAEINMLHRSAEIGYWTHPAERGRGVMTEAVRLVVRHALLPEDVGGLGLVKVYAYAALENAASRAVLTRAGLAETNVERLGTRTRDGLRDAARHEVLASEQRAD